MKILEVGVSMFLAFTLIVGLAYLCVYSIRADNDRVKTQGIGDLRTVNHDGHRFIVNSWSEKGGIMHHPDCVCSKRKIK